MIRLTTFLFSISLAFTSLSAFAGISEVLEGRGIWVNDPAKFDARHVAFLKSIGVRRVHFMLTDDILKFNNCTGAHAPKEIVSRAGIAAAVKRADAAGLKVIVTAYVPPAKPVIDEMLNSNSLIAAAIKEGALAGVEYDLEGKWVTSTPCQFQNHREAVAYLLSKTRELRAGLPIGVTVHYGRLKSANVGMDMFDWIAAQAYSKCPYKKCAEHSVDVARPAGDDRKAMAAYNEAVSRAWDNPGNQPGTMQKAVADRLGKVKPLVLIGLPAYSQYWNEHHTVNEAMRRAHEAVLQLQRDHNNYVGANYWALTNIISSKAHPDIVAFLKATAKQQLGK